jgi:hypothetical protein
VKNWEVHEAFINDVLGLDSTPISGATWQAPGDGVDNDPHSVFPIIADCKCTEKASFSLRLQTLHQWDTKAAELGKRFILPLRFWDRGRQRGADYVVLGLDDFRELLDSHREWAAAKSELDDLSRELCCSNDHFLPEASRRIRALLGKPELTPEEL